MEHVGSAYSRAQNPSPKLALLEIDLPATGRDNAVFMYLWDPAAW
jgi:hypothetical protein